MKTLIGNTGHSHIQIVIKDLHERLIIESLLGGNRPPSPTDHLVDCGRTNNIVVLHLQETDARLEVRGQISSNRLYYLSMLILVPRNRQGDQERRQTSCNVGAVFLRDKYKNSLECLPRDMNGLRELVFLANCSLDSLLVHLKERN